MAGYTTFRVYENFQPTMNVIEEKDSDMLVLNLPGFRKEQVKVQIGTSGTLKINGERPIAGNKWSRFQKDYRTSPNCLTNQIRAKFENNALHIIMPKKVDSEAASKPATMAPPGPSPKPGTAESSKVPPPAGEAPPRQKPTTTDSSRVQPPPPPVSDSRPSRFSPPPPPPPPPPVLSPPTKNPAGTAESMKIAPPPSVSPPNTKPVATESSRNQPPPQTPSPLRDNGIQEFPPPLVVSPRSEKTSRTTESTKISPRPVVAPLSQKPTSESKISPPPPVSPPSKNPVSESKSTLPVPPLTQPGQTQPSQLSEAPTTEGLKRPEKPLVADQMAARADETTGKVRHSGGGGGSGGDGGGSSKKTIMDEYKNKIEELMMELKEKSSTDLVVNMSVASLVLVALGVYATWNLKSSGNN